MPKFNDTTIYGDLTVNGTIKGNLATTTVSGLMSTTDKSKLNDIESGAQVNTVTSVAGKTGAVELSKFDVGLSVVQNYAIAPKAQAVSGISNSLYMTPLRTKEAITAVVGDIESALDAILGV